QCLCCSYDAPLLPSFPTRRSSDLAAAQAVNSNTGTVTIIANLPESLTVNLTNPTITIPLTENTAVNNSTLPAAGTSIQTAWVLQDRKSTRLNSSHLGISYAVFCLK